MKNKVIYGNFIDVGNLKGYKIINPSVKRQDSSLIVHTSSIYPFSNRKLPTRL